MTAPARPAPAWGVWPSRLLLFIAALCALFAALTLCGTDVFGGPALAWGWGGVSAFFLSWAVP